LDAARASKVARRSSAAALAAVAAVAAALAAHRADCALAAGWLGGSGAGSSGGGIRVWLVGRGDPLATQPAGRLGAPEKSWPGCRRSACCSANAAGDGAILGADLKPDNPESDGTADDRNLVGGSAVGLKLAMNPLMSALAWSLLSTRRRSSAMRRSTEKARGMLSHGSTAFTTPSVGFCLGSASFISVLSTTTVSGHSCSVPGRRGHHGRESRVRRHDHVPATALLPITSAFLSIVTPSFAVMTALARFTAASEGTMSAGGWAVGGAETFQSRRSRLTAEDQARRWRLDQQ